MGYAYVDNGKIKANGPFGVSAELPEALRLSKVKEPVGGPWFKFYGSLYAAGWKESTILDFIAIVNGKQQLEVVAAMVAAGVPKLTAQTLADWLGGGVNADLPLIHNWGLSDATVKANAYLNPDYLVAVSTGLNVGEAAVELRSLAPLVHKWLIWKVEARAFHKIPKEIANLYQPLDKALQKTVDQTAKLAEKAGNALNSAVGGLGAGLDLLAFVSRNAIWIAAIGGGVYLYAKTRAARRATRALGV